MANVGPLFGTTGRVAFLAFRNARFWFKTGDKSNNKVYGENSSMDPAKIQRRAVGIERGDPKRGDIRKWPYQFGGSVAFGNRLIDQSIKVGNCSEMSCVALALASKLCSVDTPLWLGVLDEPADHTFALVGTALPRLLGNRPTRITDLNRLTSGTASDGDGLYVVDVWAGICCHVSEYESRFRSQMQKWSGQGKLIDTDDDGMLDPAGSFLSTHMNATLVMHRCTEGRGV
jgi:hypothetical protein